MKTALALCLLVVGSMSFAETKREAKRDARQEARLDKGIENHSVTPEEQAGIQKRRDRIDKIEQKAAANGGKMNFNQKAKVEQLQDRNSRAIHNAKHNDPAPVPAPAPESAPAPETAPAQ